VRLGARGHAALELALGAQLRERELADAQILVDPAERPALETATSDDPASISTAAWIVACSPVAHACSTW
jgi:hypothetical protein